MKLIIDVEKFWDQVGDEYMKQDKFQIHVNPGMDFVSFETNSSSYFVRTKDLKAIIALCECKNE